MIYYVLTLSFLVNIFLVWFIYKILSKHADLVALIEDIQYKIDYFRQHLDGIYELPMFYGEPTIRALIQHSKLLLSSFEQFNLDYNIFNGEEVQGESKEESEDQRRDRTAREEEEQ